MNLLIINDCGTNPGLPTAGTYPGRRYKPMGSIVYKGPSFDSSLSKQAGYEHCLKYIYTEGECGYTILQKKNRKLYKLCTNFVIVWEIEKVDVNVPVSGK